MHVYVLQAEQKEREVAGEKVEHKERLEQLNTQLNKYKDELEVWPQAQGADMACLSELWPAYSASAKCGPKFSICKKKI